MIDLSFWPAANGHIPAIVDHDPTGGSLPVSLFESGAILLYLAERSGALAGEPFKQRQDIMQSLDWQMGGLRQTFHRLILSFCRHIVIQLKARTVFLKLE